MKNSFIPGVSLAMLLLAGPLACPAAIYFSDDFVHGSTFTNATPAAPTPTSTAYQISSSKAMTSANAMPGFLKYGINSTTGGGIEVQALFTGSPVALSQVNDYVQLTVTFTNEAGLLTANGAMGFGLYNGGQVQPIAGGAMINNALNTTVDHVTGGVQNWQGYWGQLAFTGASSRILTRPIQNTGTDNRNQNLTSTGSGSQSYAGPGGAVVGSASTAASVTLVAGQTYTAVLMIQLTAANTLAITNTLYSGPNTNGAVLSQFGGVASGATYLTSTFDALAIGWRAQANTTGGTVIDISSIKVDGVSTTISGPPDITSQPVPVTVPNGGSAAYQVAASGFGMTYQWHRYQTNLTNGGNISGATSDTLIISPASAADAASGANGYYVAVTGTGNYSTNSTTNSLTLGTAKNLLWAGTGNVWDLNNSQNWLDGGNPAVFNYGDAVTFDDTAAIRTITLTGNYLSASSVTVQGSAAYTFAANSTGSFAGPGKLLYLGANQLSIANANTYTGGTIISNATAYLRLQNYSGLGSGPVTLAKAGGIMEVIPSGSASVGITGDINVQDDFTIQFDGIGAFAGVMLGDLSGVAGKRLTLTQPDLTTTNRYRIYGTSTVLNSDLIVNGGSTPYPPVNGTTLAFYQPSGSQIYNGVISGSAALIQRGSGLTILSGQNTYSGGTIPSTGTIGLGVNSTPTVGTVTSGPLGTGPFFIVPELPNTTGNGAVLAFNGARTVANPLQYLSGTNNQTLIVGGTNALTFSGPVTLNGIDGLGGPTNRIYQVTNTALTTLSGVISDGGAGFGLVKTGNGILALNNAETYTGPTLISNGVLQVNGSLGAGSAVTIATNGTLGGTGTLNGAVTVQTGGAIAPGDSVGTLTINNNLTIGGNLSVELDKSGSPTSDRIIVSGALNNTGTGTVTVTNLGPALAQGDSFTLFNKPVGNGNTLVVTGGGANVTWTNKLAVDGTIAVASVVSTSRTNITFSVSGNNLTLGWPADHTGWALQAQTNAPGQGLSANWATVPGSTGVNQVVIPMNPANGSVFFRLVSP